MCVRRDNNNLLLEAYMESYGRPTAHAKNMTKPNPKKVRTS